MGIIVFGKNGFVAKKLKLKLKNATFLSSKDINLTNIRIAKKLRNINKNSKVIFLACISPEKKIKKSFQKNIMMINNFFKFFDKKKIINFTYLSSDAVYPSKSINQSLTINEKTKVKPSNNYSKMHLNREKIILKNLPKSKVSIFRSVGIYGKGDTHLNYGINRFKTNILNGKVINIYNNGLDIRDHIFIDDVVKVISNQILNFKPGIFNLASGNSIEFIKIIKILSKKYKKKYKLKNINTKNIVSSKKFDISKLRKTFKFKPKIFSIKSIL